MLGCWPVGVIDRGAFGFSNDKSFTYCPSTPICGIACGCGLPFPSDILLISGRRTALRVG
jgi:hypothetical protein